MSDENSESGESSDISTANTMRDRTDESSWALWLLLDANRVAVTAGITVGVFAAYVVGVSLLYPPLRMQLTTADTIETTFTTMITAVVTTATLVVTIGQVVLSQENGPLGKQRRRMSDSMDFRSYVAELTGEPARADPSAFLRNLVVASADRARDVRESISEAENDDLRGEVDEFTDSIIGNADTVSDELEGSQFGTFDLMSAALDYNYGWKLFHVERIADEYEDSLDDDQLDALEQLRTTLSMFGPAREHVKTLYFEWALVDLSTYVLYTAVPALVVAGIVAMTVEPETVPGVTFGVDDIVWLTGAAYALTLLPFWILTAYILRIVTVAKRTLAIEPLILRDSQR